MCVCHYVGEIYERFLSFLDKIPPYKLGSQSISRSIDQSISQSVSQSVCLSINQSTPVQGPVSGCQKGRLNIFAIASVVDLPQKYLKEYKCFPGLLCAVVIDRQVY